ncbi:hypothetical protein GOP47_0009159 [Adiantum capillus-veneris]|uniref:RWP-RK domain-containing protein n=1 Tax=Adiantum capillus-veneris TaxID=13818 RepID=A0A9D4ZGY3_ADICA|nr:hypothetical protein GOP47_0009159 [Adiantum capillus-veneris]
MEDPHKRSIDMNGNNGNRGAGCTLADKAKFTVFVRGHQWSSARQVNETLQEFARAIEKNARRLGFISPDDKVERLQLALSADGTDPEELDVDATLEDVLICMGRKQLVALIAPAIQPELCAVGPTHIANMPSSDHHATTMPTDTDPPTVLDTENVTLGDHIPPSKYSLVTPTSAPFSREELNQTPKCTRVHAPESPIIGTQSIKSDPLTCPQLVSRVAYNPTTSTELPHEAAFKRTMYAKGLRISIPDTDMNQIGSPTNLLNNNYQAPALASNNYHQNIFLPTMAQPPSPSLTAPSSTELAQLLVKTSSIQPSQYLNPALSAGSTYVGNNPFLHNPSRLFNEILELPHPQALPPAHTFQSFNSLAPTGWINNCAEPIHPIHPMIATANSLKLPTPKIAVLAQFLASQLRAFMPTESNQSTPVPPTVNDERLHSCNTQAALHGNFVHTLQQYPEIAGLTGVSLTDANQTNDGSPCSHQDPAHCTIESRPEKDQSSSSVIDAQQNAQSQPEMIFLVNRRSKTGTGTHRLKMSELSTYFHLSVVDAAKKLGVSQTTLKKACRNFGLKRWPGRKVRSLESTIHGLEHTIAVGQGAGMEELTEAQIRSEVLKLQQEMDHLVRGLPSVQHPTALRTADLYKRLHSRGWRSKHHSSESSTCLQIDSNAEAAVTNNYPTSTLTPCNLDSCSIHTDDLETIKCDNGRRDSPVIDEARDSKYDTHYHWEINTIKSTRSKRKRRFEDVADKQDIRNDIHKHGWRDNPANLDADNFSHDVLHYSCHKELEIPLAHHQADP